VVTRNGCTVSRRRIHPLAAQNCYWSHSRPFKSIRTNIWKNCEGVLSAIADLHQRKRRYARLFNKDDREAADTADRHDNQNGTI
jgi:hypothetical protein